MMYLLILIQHMINSKFGNIYYVILLLIPSTKQQQWSGVLMGPFLL